MTMKKNLLILAFSAAAATAAAFDFKPTLDARLGGGWGADTGGLGTWNTVGRLTGIPLMQLGESDFLVPVLMVDLQRPDRVDLSTNQELRFVGRLMGLFKPQWRHNFDDGNWDLTLNGVAKRTLNKTNGTESFGSGFYDYDEFGGGAMLTRHKAWGLEKLSLNLDSSHRNYPNYRLAAAIPTGKNIYLRDLYWNRLGIQAERPSVDGNPGLRVSYDLNWSAYTDSFLVRPGGSYDYAIPRSDFYHSLTVDDSRVLGKQWLAQLNISGVLNQSNQNLFDTTIGFSDDQYSFWSYSVGPTLVWLPGSEGTNVSLGYEILNRRYIHRPVRDKAGNPQAGAQADDEQSISLAGRYALTSWLGIYAASNYGWFHSNQQYDSTTTVPSKGNLNILNYEYFSSSAGLTARY